jgi:exodeoxyribonuclease VII large subunit
MNRRDPGHGERPGPGGPGAEPPDWALPSWDAVAPSAARVARPPLVPGGTVGLRIYSVSEVARSIRDVVRADERLRDVWVEGEVGRVTISSAGHAYFALRDERNQLQCVWFRDDRMASAFEVRAGLRVVVHGRVDLYEPTGALQLYVESVQPAGFGDLAIRFEELKARLSAEGLFDSSRKRALPIRPRVVAVVTSPSGAVWHDVTTVLRRRWPLVGVVLSTCQVQGEGAAPTIVRALARIERYAADAIARGRPEDAPVVTILARGGGSLEDLWAFNDERVVRAVVGHGLPVVCGVGHETDVTLSDFAADVRAPTPSAAAELVVPDRVDVLARTAATRRRADAAIVRRAVEGRRALVEERRALDRLGPAAQLATARERAGLLLDRATRSVVSRADQGRIGLERGERRLIAVLPQRLARDRATLSRGGRVLPFAVGARVARARAAVGTAAAALAALGPQATLERGYAIVRTRDGRIVRAPADAPAGTALRLRVAQGALGATSTGAADGESERRT